MKVKKLKMMQENGQLSDYIDIGAKAANVEMANGNSLEVEMNKKPYVFNNVEEMKNVNYLKENDICITIGYYEANDGGAAKYLVKSSSTGITEALKSNLVAEMIVENEINFKAIGAKDSNNGTKFDCKNILLKYINYIKSNKLVKLNISAGFYCFSPTQITGDGCYIEGVPCKDINIVKGTMFLPMSNNQEYIICIGENDKTTQNVIMNGITFSSVNPQNKINSLSVLNAYANTNVVTETLKLINLYACDFNNINFACIRGKAIDISSICECNFTNIQLRYIYNPAKYLINFANHTENISNCSALFIDNINVESYVGNVFNFEAESNVINSKFGTIMVEDRAMFKNFYETIGSWFKADGVTKNHLGDDDYNSAASNLKNHYSLFRFENQLSNCEFTIDNLLLNNYSSLYYRANSGSIHGNKIIFNFIGKYSYANIIVNNIQHMTANVDTIFINCVPHGISSLNTKIKVNNINHFSQELNYVINTDGMYGIRDINLNTTGFNKINNNYQRFVDYIIDYKDTYTHLSSGTELGYYGGEEYDPDAESKNHIVYRYPNPYFYTNVNDKSWIKIPVQGKILRIRGKFNTALTFTAMTGVTDKKTISLSNVDNNNYKWYELDFSDVTNLESCVIYLKQANEVVDKVNVLDCFYWK